MNIMKKTILALSIAALLPVAALRADTAPATPTAHPGAHPKAKVNKRLRNQNKRIKNGVKNGQLTKPQAAQLHSEDKDIHQQEQGMRKLDGGKLTKDDKKTLNQEENGVSKQIYDEKHPAPVTTPPATTPQ